MPTHPEEGIQGSIRHALHHDHHGVTWRETVGQRMSECHTGGKWKEKSDGGAEQSESRPLGRAAGVWPRLSQRVQRSSPLNKNMYTARAQPSRYCGVCAHTHTQPARCARAQMAGVQQSHEEHRGGKIRRAAVGVETKQGEEREGGRCWRSDWQNQTLTHQLTSSMS